jgi:hypothetical protein
MFVPIPLVGALVAEHHVSVGGPLLLCRRILIAWLVHGCEDVVDCRFVGRETRWYLTLQIRSEVTIG